MAAAERLWLRAWPYGRRSASTESYEGTNAPTRVYWFGERIEILSPGGPFGVVTAESFGQPGVTDYRNLVLAEAMRVLGIVQRFGFGIPTARAELAKAGHPPPELGSTRAGCGARLARRSRNQSR